MLMDTKLGSMVTYHEELSTHKVAWLFYQMDLGYKVTLPFGHVVLQDHLTK